MQGYIYILLQKIEVVTVEVLSKYGPRNIAVRFMSHYAICALVSAFKLCPFPADESECESHCILDSSPTVSHADFAPIPATEHCGFRNGWDRAHSSQLH